MIIKNSILFTLFELINKAVPFLLLPILTRYLTPEDYGLIASFSTFVAFVGIFIGLSAPGAVDSNYFILKKDKIGVYIANVFIVLLFTLLMVLGSILLFSETVYENLNLSLEWQLIALLVALSQFITLINLSLWVIEQKPQAFGMYQIAQTILISTVTVILIIGFSFKWQGQLLAVSIGTILFSFISLITLYKRGYFRMKINKEYIKDFLKFGLPMIPHQLGGWLRGSGDKVLLISLLGTGATGLFAVGQQLGMIMSILMSSITKAFYPVLFRKLNNGLEIDEKIKIVKITYLFFIGVIIVGIILSMLFESLYPYILGKKFQNSILLTQLIVFSFVFEGMYYSIVGYIFYFKKTAKLAKITFSVSILHVTLSIVFIKFFGVIGVAYSSIISSFIQFIAVWYLSNKVYRMPWFSIFKERL